jgi:hypothetical protein
MTETLVRKMREDYPNERLTLVAALWGITQFDKHETRLYSVKETSTCLAVEDRFACAGMDTSLARFLLDSISTDSDCMMDGVHLAAFVTSVMKEKADGVGGPTQLLWHSASRQEWINPPKEVIATIEKFEFIEKSESLLADLETTIRQFCWSRFPHEFRPAKNQEVIKRLMSRKSRDQR